MTMDTAAKRVSRRKKAAEPAAAAPAASTAGTTSEETRHAAKPAAQPAESSDRLTLHKAALLSADVRTLAVNISILLIIIVIVPAVLTQFLRAQVVIDPIS